MIRLGRDDDGPGLIDLIRTCWRPYPGIVFDVDAEMPELRALATYYQGRLWVAEGPGGVAGMIACRPLHDAPGDWEICRVYVQPDGHGGGLGHALLDVAEAHAIAAGARRLLLWSDTRFDRAHGFYEKRSYVRAGGIRVLHDLSNSLEYGYAKPVDGVERLDAAAATSAERRLAEVLVACVADGASVSFLAPLAPERARAFWRGAATQVASGGRILLAGWHGGVLAGCVSLDLATPENQPHRAEVQKLLVHPDARRAGLGRALMAAAERQAAAAGRSLLTLDTRADSDAVALYRATGWHDAGCIPGYALDTEGTPRDTLLFWKVV